MVLRSVRPFNRLMQILPVCFLLALSHLLRSESFAQVGLGKSSHLEDIMSMLAVRCPWAERGKNGGNILSLQNSHGCMEGWCLSENTNSQSAQIIDGGRRARRASAQDLGKAANVWLHFVQFDVSMSIPLSLSDLQFSDVGGTLSAAQNVRWRWTKTKDVQTMLNKILKRSQRFPEFSCCRVL